MLPSRNSTLHWPQWKFHILEKVTSKLCCCSLTKSCLTLHDSMDCGTSGFPVLHYLSPRVCSSSCPLSRWCYLTISSSAALFFCLQSFSASECFPISELLASGSQSIGASALASVLPMNIQDWSLGQTGLISLQSKGLSIFCNTTVQKHRFFSAQLSL